MSAVRARIAAGYGQAIAAVAVATGISWLMFPFFELANLIMTYLLAIVVIATRYGRGPCVVASVASVGAFDYFFVPPYLTFAVADTQYLPTFAVMLIVGLVISGLTIRVRIQAEAARQRERRIAALYAMSRELAQTSAIEDLVATAARHIGDVFDAETAVFLPDPDGNLGASRQRGDAARAVYLPLLGHRLPKGEEDRVFEKFYRAAPDGRRGAGLGLAICRGVIQALLRHAGRVVTHQQLLREVWGPTHTDQAHYVRVYMAHLRHKLEAEPARPRYLLTEPGVGYRMAAD